MAKFERNLGQVTLNQHQRQWKKREDFLASLSYSVHANAVPSETCSCKNVGLIRNKASDVDDLTRCFLLTSAFIVCVVETDGNSTS